MMRISNKLMAFNKKKFLPVFIFLIIGSGIIFYYFFNPESNSFLLKCPFKFFTGLDCPGCGSQRALHSLLHGEWKQAFSYNPLFIIAIPYVFTATLFELFGLKYRFPKAHKILFGQSAIYVIVVIVILYFISRNV